jgi:hypothetical protein
LSTTDLVVTLLVIQTLALTALRLAGLGLYGVVSGTVTEWVREIGAVDPTVALRVE